MSILTEFLIHPRWTGAIAASSPALAAAMTADLQLERAGTVVELGPGTGAITEAILDRLPPDGKLVAVEVNDRFAARLARRYRDRPVEVLHASAEDLATLVAGPVDAVVSGLPWTVMPHPVRRTVLRAVADVLAPDGRFTTFAYLHATWTPPARRFQRELSRHFATVRRSDWIARNIPPAFVHHASGPISHGPERRTAAAAPDRVR
jgi:phospholipid N-methyltransferase